MKWASIAICNELLWYLAMGLCAPVRVSPEYFIHLMDGKQGYFCNKTHTDLACVSSHLLCAITYLTELGNGLVNFHLLLRKVLLV